MPNADGWLTVADIEIAGAEFEEFLRSKGIHLDPLDADLEEQCAALEPEFKRWLAARRVQ